ncbi:carboxypeptidase-like regulatory domain-containing protein [Chryseolinea sp. Jin1]|uniref:Carboxypeptidase-like regulatory domain-containing protein n=1 Tax=Chryseolinea lacunae TaxID=2801331 RepID=A0ABS1L223_9BACT|nr:carboxypeptidase-like regulatory domain-containing protein [Chryseolinea lacunae]
MKHSLFAFCFFALAAHGQEKYINLKGVVSDSQSGEPIAYASVFVKGQPQGTMSNEDGRFLLYLSPNLKTDSLVLSAIGYGRLAVAIGSLLDKEAVLKMKPSSIQLAEIVVHATDKELSAKEIVKRAVSRIPQNYPMEPFAIEGFFRDLQMENGQPVELLEAAVKFHYKDYNPGYETVEVLEVRKSFNRRHPINGTYDRQNSIRPHGRQLCETPLRPPRCKRLEVCHRQCDALRPQRCLQNLRPQERFRNRRAAHRHRDVCHSAHRTARAHGERRILSSLPEPARSLWPAGNIVHHALRVQGI